MNIQLKQFSRTITMPFAFGLLFLPGILFAQSIQELDGRGPPVASDKTPAAMSPNSKVATADPESAARHTWRSVMAHMTIPHEGCFHASYPEFVWKDVACKDTPPGAHPMHVRPKADERGTGGQKADKAETVGNGYDYVAATWGLISFADGSFPYASLSGETDVGVAQFGGGGILGLNEYTLQINSNDNATTSACAGHSGCTVWQQFVYATDFYAKGEAAVFIEYWLLDWGSKCPSGWAAQGNDCWKNGKLVGAPDISATDLANETLAAGVTPGGEDWVEFFAGNEAYVASGADSVLNIATVWNQAEFNVFGNTDGAKASFNSGSDIEVNLSLDTSGAPLTCLGPAYAGTTGESNNMTLGACQTVNTYGNYIDFNEANVTVAEVPVYRFYNGAHHFFTLSYSEGVGAEYSYEGIGFKVFTTQKNFGMYPLYRCLNPANGDHFVSTSSNCEGQINEGSYGWVSNTSGSGVTALYRFYNGAGDHLETTNYAEGANLRWSYEGILGYVPVN